MKAMFLDVTDNSYKESNRRKDKLCHLGDNGREKCGTNIIKYEIEKNPGHAQFVPVNDFNISHLSKGYNDNDIVDFIKATADLTVRVDVKMTSAERPEFWPNTKVPYAFYDMRKSEVMRVGTAKVRYVNKWTEEDNNGTCQCHKCLKSDTPSKVWGKVFMCTATHVVFDDLEARHTTCRLFFDRQDSPLVTLDGWTVEYSNIEEDRCGLKCLTCDVGLLDELNMLRQHWFDLWRIVTNRYRSSRDKDTLTFIVSHPHGCPKHISVGLRINRYLMGEIVLCTGTRHVHVQAAVGLMSNHSGMMICGINGRHVHNEVNSEGQNYSGAGRDYLKNR